MEPKPIQDSQNDSMPYALYLNIIPQCSRLLPPKHILFRPMPKRPFSPPVPPFTQFDTFTCGV